MDTLGISERHAYRLVAGCNDNCNDRKNRQALLLKYVILEAADPVQAAELTPFLDELVHALLERPMTLTPGTIERAWGKALGFRVRTLLNDAITRRQERLSEHHETFLP